MTFLRKFWVQGSAPPSMNADELNRLEQGIEDAHALAVRGQNKASDTVLLSAAYVSRLQLANVTLKTGTCLVIGRYYGYNRSGGSRAVNGRVVRDGITSPGSMGDESWTPIIAHYAGEWTPFTATIIHPETIPADGSYTFDLELWAAAADADVRHRSLVVLQ